MTPDEWQRVSSTLDEALALEGPAQSRYLDELRTRDSWLCREVESLLREQQPSSRLDGLPTILRDEIASNGSPSKTIPKDPKRVTESLPTVEGYEILELAGAGGMGVVYKARHIALNRLVGLKMVRLGGYVSSEERKRFQIEAEAVAQLHHPNIVQIYDVGHQNNQPYLALEFIDGGGLDRLLGGTPQDPRTAAEFVEGLARAVHYAHSRGIIHRDLKPANILLTFNREPPDSALAALAGGSRLNACVPHITDFGLARFTQADSGNTQTGAIMGTPSYMSPEQASGRSTTLSSNGPTTAAVGPATDIYALGAILYEMLTGRPPFRGTSTLDTLEQVRRDEPVPPSHLQPRLPRDLQTICLKCVRKSPAERYPSAEVLAEDLRRFLGGRPILARPVGRLERTWRWCRRNPKDAALITAILFALTLAIVGYLWVTGARQAAERDRLNREREALDRKARANMQAERSLKEAEVRWEQARSASVDDAHPWRLALEAAARAKEVADANADIIDDDIQQRVEATLNSVTVAEAEARLRADTFAQDKRMLAELAKLVRSQPQLVHAGGRGFVVPWKGDRAYLRVFLDVYGIDLNKLEQAEQRIRTSAIKPQLLAAMVAWIPLRTGRERLILVDLIDRLDPPGELQQALRGALVSDDKPRLRKLAERDLSSLPPHVIFDIAIALTNASEYGAAKALLLPAQERFPDDEGINFHLAFCFSNIEPRQYAEEIRFYTAAVALDPKNSMARNSLGNALLESHRLDEAAFQYEAALRLEPKNAFALANLGKILADQGKLQEAVTKYQAAIKLDDRDPMTHNNLGAVFWEMGMLDESIAEYRLAVKLDGQNAESYYNLGGSLYIHGEFDSAKEAYGQAVQWLPRGDGRRAGYENAVQVAELARVMNGQLDDVLQGKKQPADANDRRNWAMVCKYKGYTAAATRMYKESFEGNPALAEGHRFKAAQAAAQAGQGVGQDAGQITDEQRAAFRTQARDWLRQDLKGLTAKVEGNDSAQKRDAARQLRVWQCRVEFGGLREEDGLRKLPLEEREAWQQFWKEMAALIDRTSAVR